VALSPEDLSDTDNRILEQLQEGRVTPQYLADQLDISRPYASDKLRRFVEHGHVERLASGLYELKNDPRD
jgi:DNA-binding IclR family transcriptional regulator